MNPLSTEIINNIAKRLGLTLEVNAVIQIQEIFTPLVNKLWNNVKNVNDVINNWNTIIKYGKYNSMSLQQHNDWTNKNLSEQEQFQKLLLDEVEILIDDLLLGVRKNHSGKSKISINDIYSTIFNFSPNPMGVGKWAIILDLSPMENNELYQKVNNRLIDSYVSTNITNKVINKIYKTLLNFKKESRIDTSAYDFIRKLLSNKNLDLVNLKDYDPSSNYKSSPRSLNEHILKYIPCNLGTRLISDKDLNSKLNDLDAGTLAIYEYMISEILELSSDFARNNHNSNTVDIYSILNGVYSNKEMLCVLFD